jgi:glycosyltransferase involved in cell wall biosynthesis
VRARVVVARGPVWLAIARGRPATGAIRVFYGRDAVPTRDEPAHGGMLKFQGLAETFPNAPRDFNVLYLGSSTLPEDADVLVRLARRRGAAVVWNQDGVAYHGWHGPGYERVNAPRARLLHAADHVVFQSAFCKVGADRFYGERHGAWEILHNPVDTNHFTPAARGPERPTLLLGGNQYQRYRLETALETLARLPEEWLLLVTGALSWGGGGEAPRREAADRVDALGLRGRVSFTGRYTQAEAPALLHGAHVLLHTKYNDPCPTIVLEAMATGLPVVYSASGGTPELVGPDAGVGVPAPLDWEADHPPDPDALADGVQRVFSRLGEYSAAARRQAERFELSRWVERHRVLFESLVA